MTSNTFRQTPRRAAAPRSFALLRVFAVVMLAATLAGCASAPPPRGGDETARFESIRARFEKGDYAQVILELQEFLGDHPGSRYADEGIFLLGRAYYEDGNFPEAEDRFRRILTDYPESPFAADASYHLGLALLSQSRSPQLDQTETISALTQFRSFIVRYPKSPLVERAQGHIADIRTKLAEKEYLTGELYYRLGAQPAARLYLKDKVLVDYADTPVAAKAMLKLAESYRKTGDWTEVAEWAARLEREHPESPEAASADRAARRGTASRGAGPRRGLGARLQCPPQFRELTCVDSACSGARSTPSTGGIFTSGSSPRRRRAWMRSSSSPPRARRTRPTALSPPPRIAWRCCGWHCGARPAPA